MGRLHWWEPLVWGFVSLGLIHRTANNLECSWGAVVREADLGVVIPPPRAGPVGLGERNMMINRRLASSLQQVAGERVSPSTSLDTATTRVERDRDQRISDQHVVAGRDAVAVEVRPTTRLIGVAAIWSTRRVRVGNSQRCKSFKGLGHDI